MRSYLVLGVMLLAAGGGSGYWYYNSTLPAVHNFKTTAVRRGDLTSFIGATGTLEPEEVVDVGAQVAGQILKFGTDRGGKPIDYCSEVDEGTVLAQIDDSLYSAALKTAQSQIEIDKANIENAQANLEMLKAKLSQARSDLQQLQAAIDNARGLLAQYRAKLDDAAADWARAQKLGPSEALSQENFDSFKAAYEMAKANVISGEAAVKQAQANAVSGQAVIEQAQASLAAGQAQIKQAEANKDHDEAAVKTAQINLDYCTIKSPVKGTIIDRRVNIGETVVASLSTPSLFLIGKDLKRLQIWAPVNEADIGNIRPGQAVTFTIDAFPGQTFKGSVLKKLLNATMTNNVVTYTVWVAVDNSENKLGPYLTANAKFEVARAEKALLVPNAALRWQPDPTMLSPETAAKEKERQERRAASGTGGGTGGSGHGGGHGKVWVQDGFFVRPIHVKVGINDGTNTVVESDEMSEETAVVTGEAVARPGGGENKNPFVPQMPRPAQAPRPPQPQGGG